MSSQKSILLFGGDELQLSILNKCMDNDLFTVVIDPNPEAKGKAIASAFEVVDGQDFEGTCEVIEKYDVDAILTAATDKPLVMMARAAEKYRLPFFSVDTAISSTDKYLMKQKFQENNISCAKGILSSELNDDIKFPVIIKPRDNSGSRGVFYCKTEKEAESAIEKSFLYSKKATILIEEVIGGKEYSIESIHYNGVTKVIQYTEKVTTEFPYNVELGHIQPADLSEEQKENIKNIIERIAKAFQFNNCASHTELKINDKGIFIIETSPRLGGDYITSTLTPLSTGIDIEQCLIDISLGKTPKIDNIKEASSAIFYFNLNQGILKKNIDIKLLSQQQGVIKTQFTLKENSNIPIITNSLERYGFFIIKEENRMGLIRLKNNILDEIQKEIEIM